MEKSKDSGGTTRKAYTRPTLKQVPLRPEEAVLGGCKVAGQSGRNIGGSCSIPTNCNELIS